jgi:putative inorganic carbon (HCO3(-)) transporter
VTRQLKRLVHRIGVLEPVAVVLAAPFLLFPTFRPAWTIAALAMLLLVWLLRWIDTGKPGVETPIDVPLLLLAAMIPIAVWASTLPELTLPKLTGLILGLATFRATINAVRSDHGVRWATAVFLALGLALATLGLVGTNWADKLPALEPVLKRVPQLVRGLPGAEGGINANELGGALTLFLPISLAASQVRFSNRKRIDWAVRLVALFVSLFFGTVLVLTQSRSAWIGVALGLGVMAWLRWRWALWVFIGAVLLLVLGLVYVGPQEALQAVFGSVDLTTTGAGVGSIELAGRVELWNRALYAIQDFPLTGCGLGTFRQIVRVLYPLFFVGPDIDIGHAHNVFLQVTLDLGLPGLIAYLAMVGIALWIGWRVARAPEGEKRWLGLGIVGAQVAFHVYGLTDAIALGAKPGVSFWMLMALTMALWNIGPGAGQDSTRDVESPKSDDV